MTRKQIANLLIPLFLLFPSLSAAKDLFDFFKNREVDFIPVPVFETRPDEGNSYGLLPVVLLSDKNKLIKAIFAGLGQYNTTTKWGGGALAYFYPEADQEIQFYGEGAEHFLTEAGARYLNPTLLNRFYLEGNFSFLKTPFGFFYGLGAQSAESGESNYRSTNWLFDLTGGYYFLNHLRTNLIVRLHSTDLQSRAILDIDDTLTRYGSLPEVVDATNIIYGTSLVWDTRKNREYSHRGASATLGYSFSSPSLGSDQTFQDLHLEVIHLFPLIKNRLTQASRLYFQQLFGDTIPIYELSSLGGPEELRSFIPSRYVDKGKLIFQIEERIHLFSWKVLGTPFDINADPFFEVGRVFDTANHLGFNYWQSVGGLGLRLFVPPNVVGRMDIAIGSEGLEIYTGLGYPF